MASVPSPKSLGLRCVQNGPPARRSEPDWRLAGAYLNRYVTDPAGAGQPPAHFQRNPLGRGQLAVFPSRGRGTRSARIDPDMGASLAP
jgi:hypothetical protein